MKIILTEIKPLKLEYLGEELWEYQYIVQENKGIYLYLSITTKGVPQYKECVEKVIREYYSLSLEFDLINSANKDILLGKTDTENIKKYLEYLKLVDEIKAKVKKDLGN